MVGSKCEEINPCTEPDRGGCHLMVCNWSCHLFFSASPLVGGSLESH